MSVSLGRIAAEWPVIWPGPRFPRKGIVVTAVVEGSLAMISRSVVCAPPVRNGGQECGTGVLECITTLGHNIIRLPGSGVPKAAAAQGDSRPRPSFLVVATAGPLVAPQPLLLGQCRAPVVRVAPPPAGGRLRLTR